MVSCFTGFVDRPSGVMSRFQVFSEDSKRFRRNLLRLKRLVLIGGPDDGVITPWQSR